jgi:uncharacterized protein (TIGR02145 family)
VKKIYFLIILLFLIDLISAQNKTLTLYYEEDSTNVINISDVDSISIFICGDSKVSYGSKDYNTVLIGDQCWLKENLNVGTMINGNVNQTNNSIIEKYCYNNDPANCTTYGGLYQWNEAMQYLTGEGTKGICPKGWHVPSSAEFQALINFVNNDGNALKREDQGAGAGQGTNTSGFSALLAGLLTSYNNFTHLSSYGYTWSSTEASATTAYYLWLNSSNSTTSFTGSTNKSFSFSFRCLKD